MLKTIRLLLCSLILISLTLPAQNINGEASYNIKKAPAPITLDGILDDEAWQQAEKGGGFWQAFPTDTRAAIDTTQFMVSYDDEYLYVGVICYDYLPGKQITTTLKRDFIWPLNDNISFYIDPYNDKSNGFSFQVTPDNVQREGIVTLGGEVASDWDNKWFSEVQVLEDRWTVEMAIPFKSFRFNSVPQWNIQFLRNNQKRNERTTWILTPQQFRSSDLVYTGAMNWDTPPPEAGTNLTIIPYTIAGTGRDFDAGENTRTNTDAGFDAKIGVTNSLNLDLTFNPDFSQVEVDQQVTNLQRFEIFFPEKRQFFLENQDLFAENGFRPSRPFFSRRIGIQGSGSTQRNVPIWGGARLSGKIGDKWRIGALNMVSKEDQIVENDTANIAPSQNYSMAILERQINRSRISAVFVGRTNLGIGDDTDSATYIDNKVYDLTDYNYVYGLDYNLTTQDNKWVGSAFYHRSVDPVKKSDNSSHGRFLRYQTRNISARFYHLYIGSNYNAEVGFVQRRGVMNYGTGIEYTWYPEGSSIQRHGPEFNIRRSAETNWDVLDKSWQLEYGIGFLNTMEINASYEKQSIKLQQPFDPSGTDGPELAEGTITTFGNAQISIRSDRRKPFVLGVFGGHGNFYNGTITSYGGGLQYRYQPILQLAIEAEYNSVNLPQGFNDSELLLVSPRIDLTLTNKVFFTSFIQFNTQDENFGQNYRFQWRFAPVSDLFIVYTDNYRTSDPENWDVRNRALVIKLNYWLNL